MTALKEGPAGEGDLLTPYAGRIADPNRGRVGQLPPVVPFGPGDAVPLR